MDVSDIISRVRTFTDKEIGINRQQPVLVGLSGGADSVALLDILIRLRYTCIACHCNFQLRGDESVRDRNFSSDTAGRLCVPFREVVFETREYAAKERLSIEMACRKLRYDWFEEQRREAGASCIAVAHHRDDSVETVILNLTRGTGIAGLTGIHPVNGYIVRPLLCLSREEIETYLFARGLSYITDSTNRESVFVRNKIRLQILPLLKTLNPSVYEAIDRTARNVREAETLYREAVKGYSARIAYRKGDEFHISIGRLMESGVPGTLLFEMLTPFGFLPSQLEDILQSADSQPGKFFDSPSFRLVRDRDDFIVFPSPEDTDEIHYIEEGTGRITVPVELTLTRIENPEGYIIPKDPNIAVFDAAKIVYPLVIRHWKEGDRFVPFGMKGSRKLSDYFSDQKYSLAEKRKALVMLSENEIIWLIGARTSEKTRISCETSCILEIKCEK